MKTFREHTGHQNEYLRYLLVCCEEMAYLSHSDTPKIRHRRFQKIKNVDFSSKKIELVFLPRKNYELVAGDGVTVTHAH